MTVNLDEFERQWVNVAEEVVKRVFASDTIQELKTQLRSKGSLTWEQKSQFIVIADQIKNDIISERYGEQSSATYQEFLNQWQEWQKERGRKREHAANLYEENIAHFLYNSTPDPEQFLREYDINK